MIISLAPPSSPAGGSSSAGWKMNFTEPARRSRRPASTVATLIRMATWASWPQACMTPTDSPFQVVRSFEANGTSARSSTGSPSMSARRATTGPGRAPCSRPTTPVTPTSVRTSSKPSSRRCAATMPAVRTSRLPSSGWACRSRRQAIRRGWIAATPASISAARRLAAMRLAGTASPGAMGRLSPPRRAVRPGSLPRRFNRPPTTAPAGSGARPGRGRAARAATRRGRSAWPGRRRTGASRRRRPRPRSCR